MSHAGLWLFSLNTSWLPVFDWMVDVSSLTVSSITSLIGDFWVVLDLLLQWDEAIERISASSLAPLGTMVPTNLDASLFSITWILSGLVLS